VEALTVLLVDVLDTLLVDALVEVPVDAGLRFSLEATGRRRRMRVAAEERGGDGGMGRALRAALRAT
jgi:hypothetical protein